MDAIITGKTILHGPIFSLYWFEEVQTSFWRQAFVFLSEGWLKKRILELLNMLFATFRGHCLGFFFYYYHYYYFIVI